LWRRIDVEKEAVFVNYSGIKSIDRGNPSSTRLWTKRGLSVYLDNLNLLFNGGGATGACQRRWPTGGAAYRTLLTSWLFVDCFSSEIRYNPRVPDM